MAFETLFRVTPVLLFSLASHHALLCSRYSRCAGHVRVFLLCHASRHLMAFAFAVSPPGILASSSQSRCFSVFRSPLQCHSFKEAFSDIPSRFYIPWIWVLIIPWAFPLCTCHKLSDGRDCLFSSPLFIQPLVECQGHGRCPIIIWMKTNSSEWFSG